jgi:hypothetical protein
MGNQNTNSTGTVSPNPNQKSKFTVSPNPNQKPKFTVSPNPNQTTVGQRESKLNWNNVAQS